MKYAVTALILAAPAAHACPQYDTVVAAVQANDRTGAEVLYEEIVFSATCDDAIREWVGDYLARENFLAAADTTDPAEKRTYLERALGFEKHWRSYAALGQVEWDAKNYADAATQLQLALNELSEGDQTHAADTAEIAEVYELASAALALADEAVALPKTRSGTTGGVFQTAIRGFNIEEVNLPITFEYNSTAFDSIGESYAQALVDHILLTDPDTVALDGHTDPVGGEDFNLALSRDRAEEVKALLIQSGYDGTITVTGLGETQLPSAPPGIAPGSDEHFRIARRVAFSLN